MTGINSSFPTASSGHNDIEQFIIMSDQLLPRQTLRECVEQSLTTYFIELEGQSTTDLYALVLQQVEKPLLLCTLRHTQHNQTKAAELLGLNRGTLRKKLKEYDLL